MKAMLILISTLMLGGCAGRGLMSGAVDGEVMFRVQETGAGASMSWLPWGQGSGDIGGCRVETTDSPIEGSLTVNYTGEKCSVRYDR